MGKMKTETTLSGLSLGHSEAKMRVSSNHEPRGMIVSVHVSVSGVDFYRWIWTSFSFILNEKDMVPR